ncbi:MAG: hypothetical protein AB8C95_11950 [Phycisphaeraceae bacterium]
MLKTTTRSLLVAGVLSLTFGLTANSFGDIEPAPNAAPNAAKQAPNPAHPQGPDICILPAPEPGVVAPVDPPAAPKPIAADAPLIQIAILLDTSNSMDGLIDQAKAQLWMIVNRFAKAQRDGLDPNFQIALFEYGNTALPAEEGYIRQVVSFTNDLDKVSAGLFALKTNGGDEYCGQVINEALDRLSWSEKANDFKAIYIAGNEPFTQGDVNYVGVCERALGKGVLINTIHCGKHEAGVSGMWQHGAQLAGGSYMTINQDRSLVHKPAPQDQALAELNIDLNSTYLHYGEKGVELKEQQAELDHSNKALSADAGAQRIQTKAGKLYSNAHWDLVDASQGKDFDLKEIPADQLPEDMRKLTLEEKQKRIDKMASERKAIQAKIKQLGAERDKHIAQERRAAADKEGETLGEAINNTIDKQLEGQGYEIKEEVKQAPKEAEKIEEKKPAEEE